MSNGERRWQGVMRSARLVLVGAGLGLQVLHEHPQHVAHGPAHRVRGRLVHALFLPPGRRLASPGRPQRSSLHRHPSMIVFLFWDYSAPTCSSLHRHPSPKRVS